MRILHLLDEPWDSGITAYAIQVVSLLQKHGYENVLGVRPGKRPETLAQEKHILTRAVSSPFHVYSLLKNESWDLINVHTGRTHTWAVLARFLHAKASNIPVIRTRGDARPLKINPLTRFIYNRSQAVIAASDHVRRQYETGFRLNEEEVRTIYPSVNPDAAIKDYPSRTIGILGRLDPVKGHSVFLESASRIIKKFPDAKFLIAGKEANISAQLLLNQAKQLGVAHHVQFLGFQPSAAEFMRSCTLGVIASIGSEEVSRACLEWMGTGRPLVGTMVGCLPELIEPQETGALVPPGDSRAMAEAILDLLEDSEKAEKWGKAGHSLVQRRFSPRIQLEKTLQLYTLVLEKSRNKKV